MACAEPNDAIRRSHSLSVMARRLLLTKRRTWLLFIWCLAATMLPTKVQPASAIVGGTSALGNTAVVRLINENSTCSGALWTTRIVITAGHCVVSANGTLTTQPVFVFAPGVNTDQSRQTVTSSAIVTVDGWRREGNLSQPNDIAFVVLSADLPGVTISRLATTGEVAAWSLDARVVTFLGYGRTNPGGGSSPIPNAINQPLNSLAPWPGSFAATQTATTGICSGDSGGPVVTQVGSELVLIGVNSAASGPCSTSSRPSMTGFVPTAFPDLMRRALELANTTATPVITTGSASQISTTSAVLSASVAGNNFTTNVTFVYGLQPDLSGATTTVDAGQVSSPTPQSVQASVANLVPGNTYYFRADATNVAGTTIGAISSFATLGGAPVVQVGVASEVSSDAATLSGLVNANSIPTVASFQFSRLPDFSVIDGAVVAGDVDGNETAALSAPISGLEPGATYFWRVVGSNDGGTSVSTAGTFTTPTFGQPASLTTRALLKTLLISRKGITRFTVLPNQRSRTHCTLTSGNSRIVFSKPGVCRVRITITRRNKTTTGMYNLVVR